MDDDTPVRRIGFAVLAALVLYVCFFGGLDDLGLLGPDEPRYAWVAREMAESSDWVTPRLYGEPWFEKPILYYWAAGLAFRVWGVNEFAARLPSALAATLVTLGLAWLARQLYGVGAARTILLLFPTCVGTFAFARAASTDMLFSATLGLAMVASTALMFGKPSSSERLALRIAWGLFLGLAALAKGPAAVLLAGGAVFLWAVMSRRWRDAFALAHPLAVVVFLGVALPWYALCVLRNPNFMGVFFVSHNIERYLTPVFRHVQPVWFYAPILLLGLVPWTALLVGAVCDGWRVVRERAWRESAGFFVACWVLVPLLFFSFSASKLPGYILPALPALTLLVARTLTRGTDEGSKAARWMLAGVGATLVLLAATAAYWMRRLPPTWVEANRGIILALTVALIAAAATVAVLALRGRVHMAMRSYALLMAALIAGIVYGVLPTLDNELSARQVATRLQETQRAGQMVYAYELHRAWDYGLRFYLRQPLAPWDPGRVPALVCTSPRGVAEIERLGMRVAGLPGDFPKQATIVSVDSKR